MRIEHDSEIKTFSTIKIIARKGRDPRAFNCIKRLYAYGGLRTVSNVSIEWSDRTLPDSMDPDSVYGRYQFTRNAEVKIICYSKCAFQVVENLLKRNGIQISL